MSTSLLPAPAPARLAALLSSGMAAITAAALIAPATATAATPHPAPGAAANPSGNFLKLWTAEWMAPHGSYTQEQAVALASRVDYIAAMRGKFTAANLAAMRAANPDLRIGVYRNATFGGKALDESLYARNAAGSRIYALDWPTTFLMKLDSPSWSSSLTASCAEMISKSGYDDCYLDVLGSGPLTSVYLSSKPVNADGSLWSPNQWIAATSRLAIATKAALGGRGVTGNGIGHGGRYFSTTMSSRPLVAATDQVAAEGFVRDAKSGVGSFRREAAWKQDVDMLIDAEAQGKGMLTVTKVWTAATPAQQDAWHEYSLATFLLGTGGKSMFYFLRDRTLNATQMDHPFNLIDPGVPTGAYRFESGVYQRDYTAALVLVNPTKAVATVPLTRSYTTLTGAPVTGSITLAPNTAKILRF
ncbi:putative glycoside hydrolase [Nostocoides sp.]|uniref:putative glycoside hydrolase n=2 Tax=Nostocoides sp. TaxID=1917966 RepID=UPI002BE15FB5|nr:putative glycoside hydrolase [Tetrasphaera sp.]